MKFKTETYKGIAIQCIKKILGNGNPVVIAKWKYQGKPYEVKGMTKDVAVTTAKQRIDRII